MYAPAIPAGPSNGARPVSIEQAGQRVPDVTVETAPAKHTAAGARVAAHELSVAHVTGQTISVSVRTDATASSVYLKLDGTPLALGGQSIVSGTPEGAFDGYVAMQPDGTSPDGDLMWRVDGIDVSTLAEGMHVLRAQAARTSESGAVVWNTFVAPLLMDQVPDEIPPYAPLDGDGDGTATSDDNCPTTYNPDQADFDGDGVGDLCDLCPLSGKLEMIDADGCKALTDAEEQQVLAVVDDVMNDKATVADLVKVEDQVDQ
jgi:hypothetical protein